ncbi:MAG: hypothetical protein BGO99_13305 [Nitrosospira sp. 56-18]|nr:MAG: hypothetical protein BGO99_13305 [Nitrosospira sp. 56-18]
MWCRMEITFPIRHSAPRAHRSLNIVMDLFAPELREYPLEVRLIKVEGGEEREVLSVPAQEYESENIALAVDLEPLVKYNILLIGNSETGEPETLVTIPLEVRRAGDFVHTSKGTGWGFLVMVAALAGFVGGLHPSLESNKTSRIAIIS